MSLRFKTTLFVALVVAAMVFAIRAGVSLVIEREFDEAEATQLRERVARVVAIVGTIGEEFDARFSDWSQWDDTAEFAVNGGSAYIDSNVNAIALENMNVDMMFLATASGEERLAVQLDRESGRMREVDAGFRSHLTPDRLLRGIASSGPSFGGLLRVDAVPYLVCSRPVLWNDGSPCDPPARLVVARRIDDDWQARLRRFTLLDLTLLPTDVETPYSARRIGEARIEATETLHDLYGAPILSIRLDSDRPTLERARRALASSAWAVLACGIGALLLALFALRLSVLQPIRALLGGVANLERGAATRIEVRTSDEFAELARAFERMSQRVLDREQELTRAHGEVARLLDHLRQGVLSFDGAGAIDARSSKRTPELLDRQEIAGLNIADVLYDGAPEEDLERAAFVDWCDLVAGCSAADWSEFGELAPTELTLHPGAARERHLRLDFEPIFEAGRLARVMLLLSDVTEAHRLRAENESSRVAHDRQLADLRRELAFGPHRAAQFLAEARSRIERIHAELSERGDRREALRQAHTLKGDSRLFEFDELEQAANDLEARLADGDVGRADSIGDDLDARVRKLRDAVDGAERRLVEASPIGAAVLDQTPVRRSDLDQLADAVITLAEAFDAQALSGLAAISRRLSARPFGELAQPLVDQAARWAADEGRQISCVVEGRETPIPADLSEAMSSALTHLARNAVAHAFEPPTERVALGKPALATFALTAFETDHGPRIEVRDDGRGVDRAALVAAARARGGEAQLADALELLFVDGLTTHAHADDLAGRGVGLPAVRSELDRAGFSIVVESTEGVGSRFVIAPHGARSADERFAPARERFEAQ